MLKIEDKSKAYRETIVIMRLAEIGMPNEVIHGVLKHMRVTNWFDMPKKKSILSLHTVGKPMTIEFNFDGYFVKDYPTMEIK